MKKRNIILIISIVVLLVVGSVVGITVFNKHKTTQNDTLTIAFYDTNTSIKDALTTLIQDFGQTNEKSISFYKIDGQSELSEQIQKNKIDLVIAPAGYAVKKVVAVAPEKASAPEQSLTQMFSTMRQSAISKDKKLLGVPLVFDNLEIDIDLSEFYSSGMQSIATWKDIEEFAQGQKQKLDYPVSFAGADPVFLLDLLGALCEAFDGIDAYNNAARILNQDVLYSTFDAKETAARLFFGDDAPLTNSINFLKEYSKKAYLTPSSRQLRHTDINSYIQQRVTHVFFSTLSIHRTYDTKSIERFSSIYVPSQERPTQRHFTATTTYAVPVNTSKKDLTDNLITFLVSKETQEKLSQMTGLAPVLANCSTADKQADDARFWIAATATPVAGLGHEAPFTKQQLEQLRDAIWDLTY